MHSYVSRTLDPLSDPRPATGWKVVHAFEVGGRRWSVEAAPTQAFAARHQDSTHLFVLIAGIILTALLVAYLAWQSSVNRRILRANAEQRRAEERQAGFGRVLDESHDEIYVFGEPVHQRGSRDAR